MEVEDNVIDRNDFFLPSDDERGGGDERMEEEEAGTSDDGMDLDFEEDFDAFVDQLYRDRLKPLMQKIGGDLDASQDIRFSSEFGNVQTLHLGADESLPLILRPRARWEFSSAIEKAGIHSIERLILALVCTDRELDEAQIPADMRSACFMELGKAFALCDKLRSVDVTIHLPSADMDDAYSRMMRVMPQIETLTFSVLNTNDEYVPISLLRSVWYMPNLSDFELGEANHFTVQSCCQSLMHSMSLKRFVWQNNVLSFEDRRVVSQVEAAALSRLFRLGRLECVELQRLNMSDVATTRAICESIIECTRLKKLSMINLDLGTGRNEFYGLLGQGLPRMKNLVYVQFAIGNEREDHGVLGPEFEVDEKCQLDILHGAARAPKLHDLMLPNCYWTQTLALSLGDCVTLSPTIRELEIRGTTAHDQPTALSSLKPVLANCRLESLRCFLVEKEDVAAIVSGIALNQSIHMLSIRCPKLCFDAMSQICYSLRLNPSLKELSCSSQEFQRSEHSIFRAEQEVEESPKAFERLLTALSTNVELESIDLRPYSFAHEELNATIQVFTRLNKQGRRYIAATDKPDFVEKACQFFEGVNDSLDCLFVHLHDIPVVFNRN